MALVFPLRGHPSHLGALPILPRTRALDGSTHQPSQAALRALNSLSGTAFRLDGPLPALVGTKCPWWQLHRTPEQVASGHGVSQSKETLHGWNFTLEETSGLLEVARGDTGRTGRGGSRLVLAVTSSAAALSHLSLLGLGCCFCEVRGLG